MEVEKLGTSEDVVVVRLCDVDTTAPGHHVPTSSLREAAAALLDPKEYATALQYRRECDQRMALCSRLMQQQLLRAYSRRGSSAGGSPPETLSSTSFAATPGSRHVNVPVLHPNVASTTVERSGASSPLHAAAFSLDNGSCLNGSSADSLTTLGATGSPVPFTLVTAAAPLSDVSTVAEPPLSAKRAPCRIFPTGTAGAVASAAPFLRADSDLAADAPASVVTSTVTAVPVQTCEHNSIPIIKAHRMRVSPENHNGDASDARVNAQDTAISLLATTPPRSGGAAPSTKATATITAEPKPPHHSAAAVSAVSAGAASRYCSPMPPRAAVDAASVSATASATQCSADCAGVAQLPTARETPPALQERERIERRRSGNKPIWIPHHTEASPFLHFNVAHDEGLVVLVAGRLLLGVDCMHVAARGKRSIPQFLQAMDPQCVRSERQYVYNTETSNCRLHAFGAEVAQTSSASPHFTTAASSGGSKSRVATKREAAKTWDGKERREHQQLLRFMRVWTSKEAFLKALGTGVYLDPGRVECRFPRHMCPAGLPLKHSMCTSSVIVSSAAAPPRSLKISAGGKATEAAEAAEVAEVAETAEVEATYVSSREEEIAARTHSDTHALMSPGETDMTEAYRPTIGDTVVAPTLASQFTVSAAVSKNREVAGASTTEQRTNGHRSRTATAAETHVHERETASAAEASSSLNSLSHAAVDTTRRKSAAPSSGQHRKKRSLQQSSVEICLTSANYIVCQ